jgi:RNA polymerase sigma factor (sigma-70 family)
MANKKGRSGPKYTTHEEDKKLVALAIDGDSNSWNILLQKYKPILYTAAKRRLSYYSDEDLEDIVMTVLGNTFVKIRQYDPERAKFFWWIVASLHNHISGLFHRKKLITPDKSISLSDIRNEVVDNDFDFTENYDREQVSRLVRLLISKLPEDLAKSITLRYFKGYTNEQIATEIGCKPGDVWYKIKKAKDMLKTLSQNGKLF